MVLAVSLKSAGALPRLGPRRPVASEDEQLGGQRGLLGAAWRGPRRRGRIYRYYVAREAIADGYETCAVTSVPAADVEGAVLDHVQKLLAAPELVARTWAAAKREGEDEITERDVTVLLADFATVWNELFPTEQARVVQLLVERVDVQENALEVRIRAEGLAGLIGELRQESERMAA
jgi:site-specific DNA recombinase